MKTSREKGVVILCRLRFGLRREEVLTFAVMSQTHTHKDMLICLRKGYIATDRGKEKER